MIYTGFATVKGINESKKGNTYISFKPRGEEYSKSALVPDSMDISGYIKGDRVEIACNIELGEMGRYPYNKQWWRLELLEIVPYEEDKDAEEE